MMDNGSLLPNPQRARPAVTFVPPFWKARSITRSNMLLRLERKLCHVSRMYFIDCHLCSAKFWSVSVMDVSGTMEYSPISGGSSHGSVEYSAKTVDSTM